MKNKTSLVALMIASITLFPLVGAADSESATTKEASKVLSDLHHSNRMEIDMGQFAKDHAKTDGVRNFGDRLISDHQDADKQLQAFASKNNIAIEEQKTSLMEDVEMRKLQSADQSKFDLEFAKAMRSDHKKDISKLQSAQKKLEGTGTADFITQVLPTLQEHERIATDLVNELEKEGKTS